MCPTERVTITQHDTVRVFMAIYDKLAEPPLQTSSGSHVVLQLRTMQDYTGFVTSSFMGGRFLMSHTQGLVTLGLQPLT